MVNYGKEENRLFEFLLQHFPKNIKFKSKKGFFSNKFNSEIFEINFRNDKLWFARIKINKSTIYYFFGFKQGNDLFLRLILKASDDFRKSDLIYFKSGKIAIEFRINKTNENFEEFFKKKFKFTHHKKDKSRLFIFIGEQGSTSIISNIVKLMKNVDFDLNLNNEKLNVVGIVKNGKIKAPKITIKTDSIKNKESNIKNYKQSSSKKIIRKNKYKNSSKSQSDLKNKSKSNINYSQEDLSLIPSIISENLPLNFLRPNQIKITSEIIEAIDEGYKNIILESGPGKIPIAATLANIYENSCILTYNDNIKNKFNYLKNLKRDKISIYNYEDVLNKSREIGKRKLLIMDDAHIIEEKIVNSFQFSFPLNEIVEDLKNEMPNLEKRFKQLNKGYAFSWVKLFKDMHSNYEVNIKNTKCIEHEKNRLLSIKNEINDVISFLENNRRFIGTYEDNHLHFDITFQPLAIDSIVNEYFLNNSEVCIFMSSTILNHEQFCKELGLDLTKVKFIHYDLPFNSNKNQIFLRNTVNMDNDCIKKNEKFLIPIIKEVLNKHENQNGLIITGKKDLTYFIKQMIDDERLSYGNTNLNKSNNSVRVIESITEDMEFPNQRCRFQIICKQPLIVWNGRTQEKNSLDPNWYEYRKAVDLVKIFSKSVRSKDDYCSIYLTDERTSRFIFEDIQKNKFIPENILDNVVDVDIKDYDNVSENLKKKFGVYYLHDYVPDKKIKRNRNKYDSNSLKLSKKIQKYKDYDKLNYVDDFNYFTDELMKAISELSNQIGDNIKKLALVGIPSSTKKRDKVASVKESIKKIDNWNKSEKAKSKYNLDKEIINLSDILYRSSDVASSHVQKKCRPSYSEHKNSIKCKENSLLTSGDVAFIILDDITTRGTIMNVCEDILIENGAKKENIFKLALFKTIFDN